MSNSVDGDSGDAFGEGMSSDPEAGLRPGGNEDQPAEQAPYGPDEEIELQAELHQNPAAMQSDTDGGHPAAGDA